MVYSNDQWIQLPTKDIYDTNMMLAAVQAAKDMYEKGVKQLEDFNKTYGDFYSPISKDMEWYNQNVTGKVRDTINDLYAQGIDPIRSAEGRAVLQRLIYSMPTGTINALKTNATNYQEYLKNKAELQAKGLYDKDQDDFIAALQGLPSEQGFSTVNPDGSVNMWGRLSPTQKMTLHDLIDPTVDNIKPGELTADEVRAFGDPYDPRRRYKGVSERMLDDAIRAGIPQIQGSPYYTYFRDLAEKQVQSAGVRPDDPNYAQLVDQVFRVNSRNAVRERLQRPDSDVDEFAAAQYKQNLEDRSWFSREQWKRNNPTAADRLAEAKAKKELAAIEGEEKTGYVPWSDRVINSVQQDLNNRAFSTYSYMADVFDDIAKSIKPIKDKNGVYVKGNIRKIYEDAAKTMRNNKLSQKDKEDFLIKNQIAQRDPSNNITMTSKFASRYDRMLRRNAKSANDYYSNFVYTPSGDTAESKLVNAAFLNNSSGTKHKTASGMTYPVFDTKDGNIHFTPIRREAVYGNTYRDGSLFKKFDDFIRGGVEAFVKTPNAKLAIVGNNYDVFQNIIVTKQELESFFQTFPSEQRREFGSTDGLAQRLGLTKYKESVRTTKDGDVNVSPDDVGYIVPITRTLDPRTVSELNMSIDKNMYGVKNAFENQSSDINAGFRAQ